ncbi:MAG: conjugal transfer protein [Gammaproteobacteria bacterium]|jgi:hypothetical protein|nr:conjugal transfer protein [Gammaproteobacteria bacterium]
MDLLTTIMICSMYHNNNIVNAIIQNGTGHEQSPLAIGIVKQVGLPAEIKTNFNSNQEASDYAKAALAQGSHAEIGKMQIPSGWLNNLSQYGVSIDDLLYPCKNVAVATDLLNQSEAYCATFTPEGNERDLCTLSFYKTGDPKSGLDYAHKILDYAVANPLATAVPGAMGPHTPPNPAVDYNSVMAESGLVLPQPVFKEEDSEVNDGKSSS